MLFVWLAMTARSGVITGVGIQGSQISVLLVTSVVLVFSSDWFAVLDTKNLTARTQKT